MLSPSETTSFWRVKYHICKCHDRTHSFQVILKVSIFQLELTHKRMYIHPWRTYAILKRQSNRTSMKQISIHCVNRGALFRYRLFNSIHRKCSLGKIYTCAMWMCLKSKSGNTVVCLWKSLAATSVRKQSKFEHHLVFIILFAVYSYDSYQLLELISTGKYEND